MQKSAIPSHFYQPDLTLSGYANALVLEPELTDEVGKVSGVEYAFGSSYMSNIPVTASRPDIDHINLESYDDTLLELTRDSVMQGDISDIFEDSGQADP